MIKLVCKRVIFYSQNDESAFFEGIAKIRGIKKWEGIGDEYTNDQLDFVGQLNFSNYNQPLSIQIPPEAPNAK